jgi:hypothetical protein
MASPVTYYNRPIDTSAGTTINIDFSSELTLDHESEVPLMTLLNKLRDEKVLTHQFKFAIGRFAPRSSAINNGGGHAATAANVAQTWTVDNGEYFVEGDVIESDLTGTTINPGVTINQCVVISVSGDVLTVKAYDPALGVAQVADDTVVRVLGSAIKEAGSGRSSRQTVPTVYSQYVQTFEDYYDVSRLQAQNRQYTDPERTRLREEGRKKHAVDGEYAAFFSKIIAETTLGGTGGGATGKTRYQMSGMEEQITTNTLSYGAALADTELYGFMTDIHSPMYSGGTKRLVLASGDLLEQVNLMASSAIRITTKDTTWGPNITEVQFAGKMWQFIETPALSDARPGEGYVVHPGYMKKRTFWPTVHEMNVQNPIDKFYKDGFYSVWAIEIRLEEIMGRIAP